jgi:hypothetical protein
LPFISILFCLLKISINISIKAKKSQKHLGSIKDHFSISLDARIQISLSSYHLLYCQLVIKDFYNRTNKGLQELDLTCLNREGLLQISIKTCSNEAGVTGSNSTGISLSDESGWIQSTYPILDLKVMLFHVEKQLAYFVSNFSLTKTCMPETY